jgi:RNA polymerase sigma-70 factor (ECF subfamily)
MTSAADGQAGAEGPIERELKGLMTAAHGGDESAYRDVLGRLSHYLRGYYRTRLARAARSAAEAEDLVQETLGLCHRTLQAYRLPAEDKSVGHGGGDRGCGGDWRM